MKKVSSAKKKKKYMARRIAALVLALAAIGATVFLYSEKTGLFLTEKDLEGIVTASDGNLYTISVEQPDGSASEETVLLAAGILPEDQIPETEDTLRVHCEYYSHKEGEPYEALTASLTKVPPIRETYHGNVLSTDGNIIRLHDGSSDTDIDVDLSTASSVPENITKGDELELTVEYYHRDKDLPRPAVDTIVRIDPTPVPEGEEYIDDDPYTTADNPNALHDGDTTSKGYSVKEINGVTYIGGILIANKTYRLPANYYPGGLTKECSAAFENLKAGGAEAGLKFWNQSGFRSYDTQRVIYNRYVARDGKKAADTYSARPGHSEHQSGLSIDVNKLTSAFGDTEEGIWLAAHAHEYGFIIRYPKGKSGITGYVYEPWHIRYIGVEMATAVYESGLCLEEYLGIDSVYYDYGA